MQDGKFLEMLFQQGFASNMTATKLKGMYPQFSMYVTCTLNSAIQSFKGSVELEIEDRKGKGSSSESG